MAAAALMMVLALLNELGTRSLFRRGKTASDFASRMAMESGRNTEAMVAMAMTEPGAGSDTSAIQTTAYLDKDTNEWVLNGEKIFCTSGKLALDESNGLVVVWATVDRSAGRAGMKPFVVEAGTPGVRVGKVEIKHGIRASDTASIVLDNARIPYDNILGSPDAQTMYGGDSTAAGSAIRQEFPVDAESVALLRRTGSVASVTNTWAMEIEPGRRFLYELSRPGGRLFRVEFDLTQPLPPPPAPWGGDPGHP